MYILRTLTIWVFTACVLLLTTHSTFAAGLSMSPAVEGVSAGNIFTTNIVVDTAGAAINSVDAQIVFPADTLEVVSVDKSNSIFSMWVEGPTYSNTTGTIHFSGGIPNPGYKGSAGKIVSVVFKAKKTGTASIVFSDSSILANDGTGTNILTTKTPAQVTVAPQSPLVEVTNRVDVTVKLPQLPTVVSATHPDQDGWYNTDKVRFDWEAPKGTIEIQTLLSRSSNAVPTISHDGTFSAVTVNSIVDGTLYFHIRYRNAGGWGPTLHYKVQTDTKAPHDFVPKIENDGLFSYITLDAKDELSGIHHYEVSINGGVSYKINPETLIDGKYKLPVLEGGSYKIEVEVYDNAGNERRVELMYDAPSVQAPQITRIPQKAVMNQSIDIGGESMYPNTRVNIYLQMEGGDVKALRTTTDESGNFTLIINDTVECELAACVIDTSGVMSVWAQLMFDNGVLSPTSEKVYVTIENTSLVKLGYSLIKTMSLMVPLIAVLIILLLLVYIGWHKFFGLKKRIHKDTRETVQDIHKAMGLYKNELYVQLKVLEKLKEDRELNRREEKVFRELADNIDNVEKFIEKKLKKY